MGNRESQENRENRESRESRGTGRAGRAATGPPPDLCRVSAGPFLRAANVTAHQGAGTIGVANCCQCPAP